MQQYLDQLSNILENGIESEDRTGTGTLSIFGTQQRFDLSKGFPLLTTKKLHFKSIAVELLWFLKGDTNIRYLKDNNVKIWDAWADEEGNLGPVYGQQWRYWTSRKTAHVDDIKYQQKLLDLGYTLEHQSESLMTYYKVIDQIKEVIHSIKTNPYSRRHIVSAWNVGDLDEMALMPCHFCFQFYVRNGKLSMNFTMRSQDFPIGFPFNLASYALLLHMVAQVCDLEVGELISNGGDVHIYNNQIEAVKEQLTREPLELPTIKLNPDIKDIDDFTLDDFEVINYKAHPHIKMPVAI